MTERDEFNNESCSGFDSVFIQEGEVLEGTEPLVTVSTWSPEVPNNLQTNLNRHQPCQRKAASIRTMVSPWVSSELECGTATFT